jgi:hypothetical protein
MKIDENWYCLVTECDTLDNARNPTSGRFFSAHNIAYRESFGGDESFAYISVGNPF